MKSRPPVELISIIAFLALIGYMIAEIGLLFLRGGMFPAQPPPGTPLMRLSAPQASGNTGIIRDRNIFNADGKMAVALGEQNGPVDKPKECTDPVPSNLPVTILGTIVHANPNRSIASIGLKNKNEQIALKTGAQLPDNPAKVFAIERNRVLFKSSPTACPEFVEMKDDSKITFGAAPVKPVQNGEVLKTSETNFEVKRNDIDRLTSNLPELLQQARAVPRMGPGGVIECFSLADIAAGSIYERLGLKRGDCIKSVNGEKIDSPAKAMELYNALRSSANTINLGIERGGKDDNYQYNITN